MGPALESSAERLGREVTAKSDSRALPAGAFPDAVFVFVMRHPAAIAVAGQKLARSSYRSAIRHWVRCHEIAADDAAHLRRVDVIHYERFVADPDRELERAFKLIGLEPHRTGEPVRRGSDDTYFRRFRSSANPLRAVDRRLAIRESSPA